MRYVPKNIVGCPLIWAEFIRNVLRYGGHNIKKKKFWILVTQVTVLDITLIALLFVTSLAT
jgi:hypothetical protein